jgi:hypothetical protein
MSSSQPPLKLLLLPSWIAHAIQVLTLKGENFLQIEGSKDGAQLTEFHVVQLGTVTAVVDGPIGILDWVINKVTNFIIGLVKVVVVDVIEVVLKVCPTFMKCHKIDEQQMSSFTITTVFTLVKAYAINNYCTNLRVI